MQSNQLVSLVHAAERYHRSVVLGVAVDGWVDEWWKADAYDRPAAECGPLDSSSSSSSTRTGSLQDKRQHDRQHNTNQQRDMRLPQPPPLPTTRRTTTTHSDAYEPFFSVAVHWTGRPLADLAVRVRRTAYVVFRTTTCMEWCTAGDE